MDRLNFKKVLTFLFAKKSSVDGDSRDARGKAETPNPEAAGRSISEKTKKILLLRSALEFDSGFSDGVTMIQTVKGLLSFVHQEIFSKINVLHELGVISNDSYASFRVLTQKTEELLTVTGTSAGQSSEELAEENVSLKRQLASLYSKHVKSDIISENELVLENDNAKLRSRLDALALRYKQSYEKIKELEGVLARQKNIEARFKLLAAKYKSQQTLVAEAQTATVSLAELECQIRNLNSKLEYQERLINALTWNNPQQATQAISSMSTQNFETKEKIDSINSDISANLADINEKIPQDNLINELIAENYQLYSKLETAESQLLEVNKLMSPIQSQNIMENLENETKTLNYIKEIKENIKGILSSYTPDKPFDIAQFRNLLQEEKNILLKALELKKTILDGLSVDSVSSRLTNKIAELTTQGKQQADLIQKQNKIIVQFKMRTEALQENLKATSNLSLENKRLKAEMHKIGQSEDQARNISEALAKIKRENFNLTSQIDKLKNTIKSLEETNAKSSSEIVQFKKENRLLIEQYNKLFGDE